MDDYRKGLPERWRAEGDDVALEPETADRAQASDPVPPAPSRTSTPNAEIDVQVRLGQELAALFKDNQVHPILIFGSRGSGKTTLLASLFRYMQQPQSHATLSLHDDLF